MATARSVLSTFIKVEGVKVGNHPLKSRFMAGLFNPPAIPSYIETWDPHIVLNYLRPLPTVDSLSLKQPTVKLVMLMAFLSAQRVQTLQSLSLYGKSGVPGKYTFLCLLYSETNNCKGRL